VWFSGPAIRSALDPRGEDISPDDRIGPTFRDVYTFVENVVRAGTRACDISTEAPWLLDMSIVDVRARSHKRTSALGKIETKDLEVAACDLLREVAAAALPDHPEEGPIAIGEYSGYHRSSRARRSLGAAKARGKSSAKNWRQTRRRLVVQAIADELYRVIYFPDLAAELASGEGVGGQ